MPESCAISGAMEMTWAQSTGLRVPTVGSLPIKPRRDGANAASHPLMVHRIVSLHVCELQAERQVTQPASPKKIILDQLLRRI